MLVPNHIAITGFMGSGKSTVAGALAAQLGRNAIDLDEVITKTHSRTPQEIITSQGEENFRELETKALARILTQNLNTVIALGGGTWTLHRNRELLNQHGAITIWLDAPFELCWERIAAAVELRPLAASRDDAKTRYDERLKLYEDAELKIEIRKADAIEEIVRRVIAELNGQSTK